MIATVLRALLEPAEALLDPSKRVFGPFLLASIALAFAVLLARGVGAGAAARALFSRRLWLHRSAVADYQVIVAKALVRGVLLGGYGVSTLVVGALTAGWLRRTTGLVPGLHASAALVGVAFTLAAFLAEDWSRYALHRLMHRVPLLWEFHKVHHSAEVLTPFSLYRTHPVEALLNGARTALVIGLVTGLFVWLFGPAVRAWEVLGVDAIGFVWTLLGGNLRHSHVWVSYGTKLEHVLVSPAQHQVHHSSDPRHVDKNFGTILAVWDWLGGSLYVTGRAREAVRFGLPASERMPSHGLAALLVGPFVAVARRLAAGASALLGGRARERALGAALAGLALVAAGCTPQSPMTMMMQPPQRLDRVQLLESFSRCTSDTHARFQTAADALAAATSAYAEAPSDAARDAAREAWHRAMDVWEAEELLRYGPAGGVNDTVGGQNLRAQIYAWPDLNRCLIEEQIASRAYEGAGFAQLATSTRGLAAIEYLLFYPGADNACGATHALNTGGAWAAIPAEELARRKAAYARAAAADVAARARELATAWGAFQTQLVTAGRGSTLFATQQLAISAAAEAVFYLDTDVKDLRLARPAGLEMGATMPRPEAVESPWARRGRRNLRHNVAGARLLLEGCAAGNALGFDDLLESAGAGALASQMRADLAAADAAIDAIPSDDLAAAITSNRDSVVRAHAALRAVTTFLKMEFTAMLQIQSTRVEGDND